MQGIVVLLNTLHIRDGERLVLGDLLVEQLVDARDAGDIDILGRVVEDRAALKIRRCLGVVIGGGDIAARAGL